MHELLTNILDTAVAKWVGNASHVLAYLFNSTSRQCCEVLVSQVPFLHNFKDTVLPSEACLNWNINWSLAQAHQQSFLGFSASFTFMIGGKAKPKARFQFNVHSWSVLEASDGTLAKEPCLDTRTESHQGGGKLLGNMSVSSTDFRKTGRHGGWHS